jgi:FkbM family methyltransferase
VEADLIYDIGANNGDDTDYYLTQGFRVLAVEAVPELAKHLNDRFAEALASGRLTVLNVAVLQQAGTFPFYVNESNSEHSSFDQEAGTRGGRFHIIEVAGMPFGRILAEHGVPYYMKVDIERADHNCIESLDAANLPAYVSIEAHRLHYLGTLYRLGYRHFKVVDQSGHNHPRAFKNETFRGRLSGKAEWYWRRFRNHYGPPPRYAPGSSGRFGESTPGEWRDFEAVAYDWLHFETGHPKRGTLNPRGWFDFHAKL